VLRRVPRAKFETGLAYSSPVGNRALNAMVRVGDSIGLLREWLRLRCAVRLFFGDKVMDVGRRGHGGLGAVAGDGDGSDDGGVFHAGDRIAATQEGGGEGAVEGVAGGGRIDSFYAIRGD